jgi:hypothetical protein
MFECFAVAWPRPAKAFDQDPDYQSVMLVLPVDAPTGADDGAARVGTSCRICPNQDCTSRREPSILSEGF